MPTGCWSFPGTAELLDLLGVSPDQGLGDRVERVEYTPPPRELDLLLGPRVDHLLHDGWQTHGPPAAGNLQAIRWV